MRKNKLYFLRSRSNVGKNGHLTVRTDIWLCVRTYGHKFEVYNTETNISRTYAREQCVYNTGHWTSWRSLPTRCHSSGLTKMNGFPPKCNRWRSSPSKTSKASQMSGQLQAWTSGTTHPRAEICSLQKHGLHQPTPVLPIGQGLLPTVPGRASTFHWQLAPACSTRLK